jgi:hypothetical protein
MAEIDLPSYFAPPMKERDKFPNDGGDVRQ